MYGSDLTLLLTADANHILRKNHMPTITQTLSRCSTTLACAIGVSLTTSAHAQSYDDRHAPDLQAEEFNFIEAWGSAPFENETSMTLLNDDSNCVLAENGLSCTESRVGLSLYDNGPDAPFFEDFGSLTSMYVRHLPVEFSYEEVDFSLVQRDYPDVITAGTAYFQEGLVSGILTTPTGYQMAVSGVIILNVVAFESPQDAILDTALFIPTHQWHDLDAAMDALDDEADTLWSFVNDAENDGAGKDRQEEEEDPFQMKNRANDCLKQYKAAKKRCKRSFDTSNRNTKRIMETCLDNVGFGDVVSGAATYGGASAVVCGGTTAVYTWWLGPFSGAATTFSGAVGGLYGGIVGAINGPADARAECRKTAADSRSHNFDLYRDCLDNARDEYEACRNN